MSRKRFGSTLPLALVGAFAAGVWVDGWIRTYGPPKPVEDTVRPKPDATESTSAARLKPDTTGAAFTGPAPVVIGSGRTSPGELPSAHLRLPLDGIDLESLKGGFDERRGGNRPHEAVDMLAPRNTPVHAVESGTIAKLFTSKAGGLTIYQFDPRQRLCYYYAHLERYADGLENGRTVSQGEIIGYVGTSGNAPPNTPHLHFAVFELNADKHWWQGKALDPYRVFKDRG